MRNPYMQENDLFHKNIPNLKMRAIEKKLSSYDKIAFDLDETLIGANHLKIYYHRYILDNKGKKDFIIVTFRTENEIHDVWDELSMDSGGKIGKELFSNLYFCKKKILQNIRYAILWKAKVCHDHGYQIIIDDLEEFVLPGCRKFGVDFMNSISLKKVEFKNTPSENF